MLPFSPCRGLQEMRALGLTDAWPLGAAKHVHKIQVGRHQRFQGAVRHHGLDGASPVRNALHKHTAHTSRDGSFKHHFMIDHASRPLQTGTHSSQKQNHLKHHSARTPTLDKIKCIAEKTVDSQQYLFNYQQCALVLCVCVSESCGVCLCSVLCLCESF